MPQRWSDIQDGLVSRRRTPVPDVLGRTATSSPHEVADLVAFLAPERAGTIDGGRAGTTPKSTVDRTGRRHESLVCTRPSEGAARIASVARSHAGAPSYSADHR